MDDREQLLAELAALRVDNEHLRCELEEADAASEKFRVLFEHSSDAHLIFDHRGIIDCNNAAVAVLRCADKHQVLRLRPAALSPELQPDGRRSLEKGAEMGRIARERGYHRFEWIHRRMTGEDFPVEVTLTPVELSSGLAILGVWHELTEIRQRESELGEQLELIRAQQAEIRRLSMPILDVWDGVLLIPVLGALDQEAARALSGPTLAAIGRACARIVIIDLTGLTGADAATARHLVDLLTAIELLGASGIVVGIGPSVALAFLTADADLSRVRTRTTLRQALLLCLRPGS